MLRESGHEHFNGCLVVPVFDAAGNVAEVYGRKITAGVNPPLHLYLPGPHRGVWSERALQGVTEDLPNAHIRECSDNPVSFHAGACVAPPERT